MHCVKRSRAAGGCVRFSAFGSSILQLGALRVINGYAGFWGGRGLYGPPPPLPALRAQAAPQEGEQGRRAPSVTPSLERAEQLAAACRAWVAFAGDVVGLLFRLLVLGAFAWCLWTYLDLVNEGRAALETEQGARNAGRTLDAFLSALSAPARGALLLRRVRENGLTVMFPLFFLCLN